MVRVRWCPRAQQYSLTREAQSPQLGTVFDEGHGELARVTLLELRDERVRPVVRDEVEAEPRCDRPERAEDRRVTDRMRDLSRVEHDLALVVVTARAAACGLVRLRSVQLDGFRGHVIPLLGRFSTLALGRRTPTG